MRKTIYVRTEDEALFERAAASGNLSQVIASALAATEEFWPSYVEGQYAPIGSRLYAIEERLKEVEFQVGRIRGEFKG